MLLVISSYPEKNLIHGNKTVGVASYAKNTLLAIKRNSPDTDITVLAEVLENSEQSYIDDGDIKVERLWKRGDLFSQLNILKYIQTSGVNKILVEYEMFMMGGFLHASFLIFLLYILKFTGKKNYLVIHQVVGDLNSFEKNPIKKFFFGLFKSIFYPILLGSAKNAVVFEEELRLRLNNKKVVVIPHAVEELPVIDREVASKELDLDANTKYILFFGYLSPYKGIDLFLEKMELPDCWRLIIAGGPNPNHANEEEYTNFIDNINKLANDKNAIVTGFLPQDKIKYYYSLCDLFVLPYRTFMSSSGPLSIAFSYEKPFILSDELNPYFRTQDFSETLHELKLQPQSFSFKFDEKDINETIKKIDESENVYKAFSTKIKNRRSWNNISKSYVSLIHDEL